MARVSRHLLVRAYPPTGVARLVGMGLGLRAGAGSSTLDHPGEAGRSEWRVALADEDKT
jgi:hypothetical protein